MLAEPGLELRDRVGRVAAIHALNLMIELAGRPAAAAFAVPPLAPFLRRRRRFPLMPPALPLTPPFAGPPFALPPFAPPALPCAPPLTLPALPLTPPFAEPPVPAPPPLAVLPALFALPPELALCPPRDVCPPVVPALVESPPAAPVDAPAPPGSLAAPPLEPPKLELPESEPHAVARKVPKRAPLTHAVRRLRSVALVKDSRAMVSLRRPFPAAWLKKVVSCKNVRLFAPWRNLRKGLA